MRLVSRGCLLLFAVNVCLLTLCAIAIYATVLPLLVPAFNFAADLTAGDFNGLASIFSPAALESLGGVPGLTQLFNRFRLSSWVWSLTSIAREGEGWRIGGSLTTREGDTESVVLTIAPVGDQWKITSLTFGPR